MSGSDPLGPDVLESGDERDGLFARSSSAPVGRRLLAVATRHRAVTTAAVVTVLAVVASGVVVSRIRNQQVAVPRVAVAGDQRVVVAPLWQANFNGRPASAVVVTVEAQLTDPDQREGSATVEAVGLTGPGIQRTSAYPALPLGHVPTAIDLTATLDCDQAELPARPEAYRVRVRGQHSGHTSEADQPLGPVAELLADQVTTGCSTWLAARDVTVTQVRGTIDTTSSNVELWMQVRNESSHIALVWNDDADSLQGQHVTNVTVGIPSGNSYTLNISVNQYRCWLWGDAAQPYTALDSPLGLRSAVGVDEKLDPSQLQQAQVTNGLVFSDTSGKALKALLVRACAGFASPSMLTDATHTSYDPTSQVLTVRVRLDVPAIPSVLVQLRPLIADDGPVALIAPTAWLPTNRAGQASTTLRFRVPRDVVCQDGGPYVVADMAARVPQGSLTRTVMFTLSAQALLSDAVKVTACPQ